MEGLQISTKSLLLTEKLEPSVRKHLKNVYATFTMANLMAVAGGYVHMYNTFIKAGIITVLGAFGMIILLIRTPYGKNKFKRLLFLFFFAFFTGCNIGPLLDIAVGVNPALIMQTLLGTSVVFICFSLSALFAPRGQYLFMGGFLLSALSMLFSFSVMNFFFGSRLISQLNIYIGLVIMCGFIIFDTQVIIEKVRSGNKDYVMHAVELFIDFIGIFKRLLDILTNKEIQNKKKKSK